VLEDPALASDLRERGLQRARAFTWEQTALRTLEVYHRVLENSA
jgi:glycosyltransferase involved in cell wall biosynthesis